MELEVPPDTGNGAANAGVPLARLLWHLHEPHRSASRNAMLALLEALLLERRILMVAEVRSPTAGRPCLNKLNLSAYISLVPHDGAT